MEGAQLKDGIHVKGWLRTLPQLLMFAKRRLNNEQLGVFVKAHCVVKPMSASLLALEVLALYSFLFITGALKQ